MLNYIMFVNCDQLFKLNSSSSVLQARCTSTTTESIFTASFVNTGGEIFSLPALFSTASSCGENRFIRANGDNLYSLPVLELIWVFSSPAPKPA